MTREEKIDSLCKWCICHACDPTHCRIFDLCQQYPFKTAWINLPDEDIDKLFEALWEGNTVAKKVMKDLTDTDNPREAAKQILFGTGSSSSPSQTAKADYGKEELTLVPRRIIHDICAAMIDEAKKIVAMGHNAKFGCSDAQLLKEAGYAQKHRDREKGVVGDE